MYSTIDLQKLVQMLDYLGISPGSAAPPHSVVLGGGTNAAPGAAGSLLASNGAVVDPSFQSLASLGIQPLLGYTPAHAGANSDITSLAGLTTALSVTQGGTGHLSLAANFLLAGNGTSAVQGIGPGSLNTALISNGPASLPTFQQLTAPIVFYSIGATGSVTLSAATKFAAEVSIDDFGANGAPDASVAANAALAASSSSTTGRYVYPVTNVISIGSGQTLYAQVGSVFNYSGGGTIALGGGANYVSTREGADQDTWYWGRNRTGTHATNVGPANLGYGGAAFNFEVHRDDMNVGADFSRALYVRHIFGGANKQGGTFAVLGEAYHQGSATNAANPQRNYVATGGNMHIQSSDGGTGTTFATAKGAYFGMATAVYADSAATNILGIIGQEIDLFSAAGASAAYTTALNLVNFSQIAGAQVDGALTIGCGSDPTYGNGIGWSMGLCFTDLNGRDPIRTSGTLIGYTWAKSGGQRSVNEGINLTGFTISGSLLQGQFSRWGETSTVISFGGKGTQVINLLGSSTTTTAPGAGGAGALPATPRGYYNAQINGTAVQFPFY